MTMPYAKPPRFPWPWRWIGGIIVSRSPGLVLLRGGNESDVSHVLQKPSEHATFRYDPKEVPAASSSLGGLYRIRQDGRQEQEIFFVPDGQALIITEVDWWHEARRRQQEPAFPARVPPVLMRFYPAKPPDPQYPGITEFFEPVAQITAPVETYDGERSFMGGTVSWTTGFVIPRGMTLTMTGFPDDGVLLRGYLMKAA